MVATFNGWDDMKEDEREALEQSEREQFLDSLTTHTSARISSFYPQISE